MSDKPLLKLRPATAQDAPFIFHSWLKAYRNAKAVQNIQNTIYFDGQHKLIEGLAKHCQFTVACSATDESQIYGYAVGEMIDTVLCVHFIYIKHPYRKLGMATTLLMSLGHVLGTPFVYTHRTEAAEKLESRGGMVYSPYLAYYGYQNA